MSWIMLALVLVFGAGPVAFAQEEAVLNSPSKMVEIVKTVVNKLNPSYETFWNVGAGEFQQGVSASLYTFTSSEIPLASLRLGFGTNETLYGGPALDLPGLTRRFVPEVIKGVATTQPLDVLWAVVGKYARVGVVGGYSFAENEPAYGLTVGAALSF